jgi:transcriptional regulator with XRE-family HTH domain
MTEVIDKIAFDQALGQRLKLTRLRLGITEQQAADAAKISLRTWRKFEAGGGGHKTLPIVCFAVHYDLGLNWCFGVGNLAPSRKPRLTLVA